MVNLIRTTVFIYEIRIIYGRTISIMSTRCSLFNSDSTEGKKKKMDE